MDPRNNNLSDPQKRGTSPVNNQNKNDNIHAGKSWDGITVAPQITPSAPPQTPTTPTSFGSSPPSTKKPKKNFGQWRSVLSTLLLLAIAPIIALSITAFALQSYQVDGASMETTLQDHDRLIVNKFPRTIARITNHPYIPNRGDIIIFNQANLPNTYLGEEKQLIKRVIGLPGDRVVIKDGFITIYNQAHPNGFNPDTAVGYRITATITSGDIDTTLQDNEIFVCGDNRSNSEDSRYFGPIKADNIVGKLVLRLLPVNKTQRF